MKLSVIKPLCAMIASLLMCLAFSLALPSKGESDWVKQPHQSAGHTQCQLQDHRPSW